MLPENGNIKQSNSVKLDVLAKQMEYTVKAVDEIKVSLSCFEKKRAEEWVEYKVEHARVVDDIEDVNGKYSQLDRDFGGKYSKLDKDTQQLQRDLQTLKDAIAPLIISNKILIWIGGILGTSVIIFVWSLITHAVEVITP